MEPTSPKVRVGPNVNIIGYGYHDDMTLTAVAIGTEAEAQEIADAQTLRRAREAIAAESTTVTVYRVLDTVPLLTVASADTIDDAREREGLYDPQPPAEELAAASRRLIDTEVGAIRAGDTVKGQLADRLPVGTVIVPDRDQDSSLSGYGEACLKLPPNIPIARERWVSLSDPAGRAAIGQDAWWNVLFVPGRTR